jgi:protein-tyrosine phosphatase
MIDLHSHVLPGIDDGPATVEASLALAREAAALGTRTLAATPHVTWDLPNDAATVADGIARLQPELDAAGIPLRLVPGGELAASRARELPEDELLGLRLGGGEWLLVECPLSVAAVGFDTLVYELQARGHRILLAHPERSPALHREPERIGMLVDAGALCSVTAGSLTGRFGSTVRRFTYELIEQGLVHSLASDAHDAVRRPPGMLAQIEEADRDLPGLADQAEWLTVDVPHAILSGGPIPPPPGPPPAQRRRGLFRRVGRSR